MTDDHHDFDEIENIAANETPADRFRRIATPRFHKAVKAIRVLKNCSGAGYEFDETQTAKIINTLQTEVDNLAAAFEGRDDNDELPTL